LRGATIKTAPDRLALQQQRLRLHDATNTMTSIAIHLPLSTTVVTYANEYIAIYFAGN